LFGVGVELKEGGLEAKIKERNAALVVGNDSNCMEMKLWKMNALRP